MPSTGGAVGKSFLVAGVTRGSWWPWMAWFCVELAKQAGLCQVGERVVGVHDVDLSPVMKIIGVD